MANETYAQSAAFQEERVKEELIPQLKKEWQENVYYCRMKLPPEHIIERFYLRLLKALEEIEKQV
jgi:predicted DNA-binding transcriptional regulator